MKPIGTQPQCVRSPWRRLLQLPVSPLRTSARLQRTPKRFLGARRGGRRRAHALRISGSEAAPRVPGSCHPRPAWRLSLPSLMHRPPEATTVRLSWRSRWSGRAERRLMFRSSLSSSSASPERINAWIVASRANAIAVLLRRSLSRPNQTALRRRQQQLPVRLHPYRPYAYRQRKLPRAPSRDRRSGPPRSRPPYYAGGSRPPGLRARGGHTGRTTPFTAQPEAPGGRERGCQDLSLAR